jgi:hypothetical protein
VLVKQPFHHSEIYLTSNYFENTNVQKSGMFVNSCLERDSELTEVKYSFKLAMIFGLVIDFAFFNSFSKT